MTVNPPPAKRIKRRVTADLRDFFTFASSLDQSYVGPFRINVRQFLSRYGSSVPVRAASGAMVMWQVNFCVGQSQDATSDPMVVTLEVVEVDVTRCQKIYCDHCRVVGWGRHPVCAKRYHFIIRNSKEESKSCLQSCLRCNSELDPVESRYLSCNCEICLKSLQKPEIFRIEDTTHLLHGLVHSNGYGHLVRINGVEGGSPVLKGCDLMDFWDHLCRLLGVRKVTVIDMSKKHNMEYRLLHAIVHGQTWFGRWGYEFGRGSFGLMFDSYREALEYLSMQHLSLFFSNSRFPRSQLQSTIALYQFLSDDPLVTVRDLFKFISSLLGWHMQKSKAKSTVLEQFCFEPRKGGSEVERCFDSILKVLKASNAQWIPWQNIKGATSLSVSSVELLRYCLKHLAGKTTDDGQVVVIRWNKVTNSVEYGLMVETTIQDCHGSKGAQNFIPSREKILNDLKYLYNTLLNPQTMHEYKPISRLESAHVSATKLLNCKNFIKHYDKTDDFAIYNPFSIQITCNIKVVDHYKDPVCPPEILILPVTATVGDLKAEMTKAVRDTYLIYQYFEADQLLDCKIASETTQIKLLFGSQGTAVINGSCNGGRRRLGIYRMEQGVEKWIVDCVCGAKDDDGERMLSCDVCGVWQHTRCSNIKDTEDVPKKFVCRHCEGE